MGSNGERVIGYTTSNMLNNHRLSFKNTVDGKTHLRRGRREGKEQVFHP